MLILSIKVKVTIRVKNKLKIKKMPEKKLLLGVIPV